MAHKNNLSNRSESGRSLLEVIGTLAVMGLISAGGIIGYSAAMRKHDANELANRLMVRAMDLSTQAMTGQDPSLSNWNPNDGKYAIPSNGVTSTPTTFTLTALNIPKSVCEQMHTLQWPFASIAPEMSACTETADMTFTFNKDLRARKAGDPTGGSGTGGDEEENQQDTCPGFIADVCTTKCVLVDGEPSYTYAEGATCGTNMVCNDSGTCGCAEGYEDDGNGGCIDINLFRYCYMTDASGNCEDWEICNTTNHTGNRILQIPNAFGTCGPTDDSIYCSQTNADGDCKRWVGCDTTKHTHIEQDALPDTKGTCCYKGGGDRHHPYCQRTNDQGQCTTWGCCDQDPSIIGIPNAYVGLTVAECILPGHVYYCLGTNANGDCRIWEDCATSNHTHIEQDKIPNAMGVCAKSGDTIYCYATNADGNCTSWKSCATSNHTHIEQDKIPNVTGVCANSGDTIYCSHTNSDGICDVWASCSYQLHTNIDQDRTPNATGTCYQYLEELLCSRTNENGDCSIWLRCGGFGTGGGLQLAQSKVPNATNECCAGDGRERFCYKTNANGQCVEFKCHEACPGYHDMDCASIDNIPNATGACACPKQELYCITTNDQEQCIVWGARNKQ